MDHSQENVFVHRWIAIRGNNSIDFWTKHHRETMDISVSIYILNEVDVSFV